MRNWVTAADAAAAWKLGASQRHASDADLLRRDARQIEDAALVGSRSGERPAALTQEDAVSSGLRNFICLTMIWLALVGGVMSIFALVTAPFGNPFAPIIFVIAGTCCALMIVELLWNPLYSTVAWVASRLSRRPAALTQDGR